MPGALAADAAAAASCSFSLFPLPCEASSSFILFLAGKQITHTHTHREGERERESASRSLQNLAWKFNTFGFKSQDMLLAPRCQEALWGWEAEEKVMVEGEWEWESSPLTRAQTNCDLHVAILHKLQKQATDEANCVCGMPRTLPTCRKRATFLSISLICQLLGCRAGGAVPVWV